jgi:hypothetical protein
MRTLDQILIELADLQQTNDLETISDRQNWTKETREELLRKTRSVSEQVASNALSIVERFLNTKVDGTPVLYLVFLRECMASEIEFLTALRTDLDTAPINESGGDLEKTFDYDWLNNHIRNRLMEIKSLSDLVDQNLNLSAAAEEL